MGAMKKSTGTTSPITFRAVAIDFFANQARRSKHGALKPYLLYRDQRASLLYLDPSFAKSQLPFSEIEPEDIEDWIHIQIDLGAAPKSIRNRHGLL